MQRVILMTRLLRLRVATQAPTYPIAPIAPVAGSRCRRREVPAGQSQGSWDTDQPPGQADLWPAVGQ